MNVVFQEVVASQLGKAKATLNDAEEGYATMMEENNMDVDVEEAESMC